MVSGVKRRATTLVLAGAVLIAATHTSSASAADPTLATVDIIDNEIEDGIYDGTIALNGSFALAPDGAGVLVRANIGGEAQLIAQGGEIGGTWSYTGTGNVFLAGPALDATADINFMGQGTFEGTNTAARVVGDTSFSGTVTFNGTTQPIAAATPHDEALEDLLAGCGQVVGTYTNRINASLQAEGARSNIRGVIALYSEPPTSEAQQLAERASQLRANPDEDAFARLFAATGLLGEVQKLQAELNATSSCPSTKEYFNLLTNVAADLIVEALNALEALESDDPVQAGIEAAGALSFLVELGVSTGATGAGAVGGRGAELLPLLRERAQAAVDYNLETSFDFDLLVQLAVLSVQNNWDLTFVEATDELGEVTDRDVLNTAGEDIPDAEGGDS